MAIGAGNFFRKGGTGLPVCAIICEYDPFHAGHEKQISLIRKAAGEDTLIVALMSGNYTQRGNPALLPKYRRAEAALRGPVDLIFEIPFPFCCSQAGVFARAGIGILNGVGGIDLLAFGSETGDEKTLSECADLLSSAEYGKTLRALVKEDRSLSLPRAREKAFSLLSGGFYPKRPNDILAVEYLAALKKSRSAVRPLCLKREEDGFSASAARKALREGDPSLLPPCAAEVYGKDPRAFADVERGAALILGLLRLSGAPVYSAAAQRSGSVEELIARASDKNATLASVKRGLWRALFDLPKDPGTPGYTTLLGANERGRAFLRERRGCFPVLTKPAHYKKLPPDAAEQFALSQKADTIYPLFLPEGMRTENPLLQRPYLP